MAKWSLAALEGGTATKSTAPMVRTTSPQVNDSGAPATSGRWSLAALRDQPTGTGGGGFEWPDLSQFDVGQFLGDLAKDTVEGAVAPVVAAVETGKGILSDPAVGVLPAAEEGEHFAEAGRQAIKGAAFWGSAFVGGKVLGIAAKPLWRAVASGGAAGATFQAVNELPEFMSKELSPEQYVGSIATTATFGALTGGVITKVPQGSSWAIRQANKVIDLVPGGPEIRDAVGRRLKETYAQTWDKFFTAGQEVLKKAGLGSLAERLRLARSTGGIGGGRLVAGFYRNVQGLKEDEKKLLGTMLDKINFRKPVEAVNVAAFKMEFAPDMAEARFADILHRARNEARRLRVIAVAMQKAGVQVYDPINDRFHSFVLRNEYLPHRITNPDIYRVGGEFRGKAVDAIQAELRSDRRTAELFVDSMADRIAQENVEFIEGRVSSLGAAHYLQGRRFNVPGYETDVAKILPQYYEHATRRLANHALFGPVEPTEAAVRATQEGMFSREDFDAMLAKPPGPEQLQMDEIIGAGGKGMIKTTLPEKPPTGAEELRIARRQEVFKQASRDLAVERRYPRAFDEINAMEDGTLKTLSRSIVRRQLGAIDAVPFGETTLSRFARLEVVTKLALGAIAQPSQMLSGIMRTEFRGSIKNMFKAFSGDAEALDFATRASVVLKGLVRQSEQSLTARDTDFLERVFFTQFDLKSRVFGALQGRAFAEHQARKMATLYRQFRGADGGLALAPERVRKQIAAIERRLIGLGLDPVAINQRGGWLTDKELLKAAQTVSTDVNFWGDSLSLPEFFRSPYGRFVTQFKSFGFQQSKLIKDHIIKPLAKGDWGPATRFALTMPLGGELIADLKALARARSARFEDTGEPDAFVLRVAENIANGAGFGLAADAFEATRYGLSGSMGLMIGPIGGTIAKGFSAGGELIRGQPVKAIRLGIEEGIPGLTAVAASVNPVARAALPAVAAVSPAISNLLLPKRERP